MKITDKKILYNFPTLDKSVPVNKVLYFDIETTGFSPDNTHLYAIGCCFIKDDNPIYRQWFLTNYNEEADLINSFLDFAKEYDILVHFNGLTFDITYIEKKCVSYNITCSLRHMKNIDIYKEFYSLKKYLDSDDCRQKTLEKLFCLNREDKYNGGELISYYAAYISFSKLSSEDAKLQSNIIFDKLFIHNFEDVSNLVILSNIVPVKKMLSSNINIINKMTECDMVKISFYPIDLSMKMQFTDALFSHFHVNEPLLSLKFENGVFELTLKILTSELKYYFKDYKNYYYLPLEDMAIHKSVGGYVDRQFREKAKKENCYCKKQSSFIPVNNLFFKDNNILCFKDNYKSDNCFIELDELNKDEHIIELICSSYLKYFFHLPS